MVRRILFLILITASCFDISAQEVFSLGREGGWGDSWLNHVLLRTGLRGQGDILLDDSEYYEDEDTVVLLHLDSPVQVDSSGHFFMEEQPEFSKRHGLFGDGCAVFQRKNGLKVQPDETTPFSPGSQWNDFTIEFWLYPAALAENEKVLDWKGLLRQNGTVLPQEISCSVSGRKLVWVFENLFMNPNGETHVIKLSGPTMIPREWHHHMIRFDSHTGVLEYLIDGIPAAVTHANYSGKENAEIFLPYIGGNSVEPLVLGGEFYGFMDEFRFSSSFRPPFSSSQYGESGTFISPVMDLGYFDSPIWNIDADYTEPGNSRIYFSYCTSNDKVDLILFKEEQKRGRSSDNSPFKWKEFSPGESLRDIKGRYILIRADFYPDPDSDTPPVLSALDISYKPAYPPAPPEGFHAESVNTDIKLSWNRSMGDQISGYMIYYGERTGEYYKYEPIDAGNTTEFTIKGLTPRKLYFFSVVAYTESEPPLYSDPSKEIKIRP